MKTLQGFLTLIGFWTVAIGLVWIGREFAIYEEVGSASISQKACERRAKFFAEHDPATKEGEAAFEKRWSEEVSDTRLEVFQELCAAAAKYRTTMPRPEWPEPPGPALSLETDQ